MARGCGTEGGSHCVVGSGHDTTIYSKLICYFWNSFWMNFHEVQWMNGTIIWAHFSCRCRFCLANDDKLLIGRCCLWYFISMSKVPLTHRRYIYIRDEKKGSSQVIDSHHIVVRKGNATNVLLCLIAPLIFANICYFLLVKVIIQFSLISLIHLKVFVVAIGGTNVKWISKWYLSDW